MISISNDFGFMSNTISYSEIAKVVTAAQAHAVRRSTDPEPVDHSRDMTFRERVFDYVFCGGVKQEYMDYLYFIVKRRDGISQRESQTNAENAGDRVNRSANNKAGMEAILGKSGRRKYEETTTELFLTDNMHNMPEQKLYIGRRTPGMTMTFALSPYGRGLNGENYLIFRDNIRRTAIGIPIALGNSSPTTAFTHFPNLTTPSFNTVGDIQIRHLEGIQKSGQLTLGDQTYKVRVTPKNELIIMMTAEDQHLDAVERRLQNLWAINNVNKQLAQLVPVPLNLVNPATFQFRHLADFIHSKFIKAIQTYNTNLNRQINDIQTELLRLERLTYPSPSDKISFQQVQEQINLLNCSRQRVAANVTCLSEQFSKISEVIFYGQPAELIKLLEARLLNFADQMARFIPLTIGNSETEEIHKLCAEQTQFASHFQMGEFEAVIHPYALENWPFHEIAPPIFVDQHLALFKLLNDPSVTWPQLKERLKRIQLEQNTSISLKTSQIYLGQKVEAFLKSVIQHDDGYFIEVRKGRFSSLYSQRLALLEKMKNALLNPEINFTANELVSIGKNRESHFSLIRREFRARGYVPNGERR